MAKALEEMIGGDLERQLPISPEQDELDAVAYGVNILVGGLAFATVDLRRARAAAEASNAAKSSFLRNASHELRTPLAVIVWLAEMLKDPEKVPPDRLVRSLAAIRTSAEELLRTTEHVLELSRLEEQDNEPVLHPVDLIGTIREAMKTLVPLAERKDLQLRAELAPGTEPIVTTHAQYVRQIVVNLLANAIKFSAEGEVIVRVQNVGSLVAIDVEDPGIGIPAEAHDRIFEPYFQVDETVSQRLGGTGVGLALSKRQALQLGGDLILAASQPGVGSVFRLLMPRSGQSTREAAPAAGAPPAPLPVSATPLEGLRVLVADDEKAVRDALCKVLEDAGALVSRATNGEEAASRALAGDFAVVLMDLRMPGIDGLDATARLRAAGYQSPIVALTASAAPEQRAACLAAGCNDYLTKPVAASELVAKLVATRRARQPHP
jgi:signal transduction histidine kinase/ActR/RegA family two-component response regulator